MTRRRPLDSPERPRRPRVLPHWTALVLILSSSLAARSLAQAPGSTTPSVDEIRASLAKTRASHGKLTLADFMAIYRPNDRLGIPVRDVRPAWNAFLGMIRPPISRDDLLEIQKANRESIHDLRVIYDFVAEGKRPSGEVVNKHERREFAFSGEKILNRSAEKGDGKQLLAGDRTDAYDGTTVRTAQSRTDGVRYGSVVPYQGPGSFYSLDANPLLLLMMGDTERIFQQPGDFHDILALMRHDGLGVFEERFDRDGRSCILFGEPGIRVFLDPERNFCITGFDRYDMAPDGPTQLVESRRMTDFQDLGNGLWLPKSIVVDEFDAGKLRLHRRLDIREWHVNEGIADDYFHLVIPKGYYVADTVRNATYVMGEKNTISEMLNAVIPAPPKPSSPLRWWLIATNVAIALGIVALSVLRRGRAKAQEGALS